MLQDLPNGVPQIVQNIQLSVAPVFLLTAIGAFLSAITTRLGRVIDRARFLEKQLPEDAQQRAIIINELRTLDRRMVLANRAVGLAVSSAILICALVAAVFMSDITDTFSVRMISSLFILSLVLLTSALFTFALEIRVSIRTVRVRAELVTNTPARYTRPSITD